MDWIPASGPWFEAGIMFVFDGGVLTDDQIAQITLDDAEARRFQFMMLDQASDRMHPRHNASFRLIVSRPACSTDALTEHPDIRYRIG